MIEQPRILGFMAHAGPVDHRGRRTKVVDGRRAGGRDDRWNELDEGGERPLAVGLAEGNEPYRRRDRLAATA